MTRGLDSGIGRGTWPGSFVLVGALPLRIENLLELFGQAGPHAGSSARGRVSIAALVASRLRGRQFLTFIH